MSVGQVEKDAKWMEGSVVSCCWVLGSFRFSSYWSRLGCLIEASTAGQVGTGVLLLRPAYEICRLCTSPM